VRPCFHQIVQRARKRVSKKLLEWSYPRNWGSFVWNEEGRSEYILSLPISSPGWLHSYLTLLLQLSFIRCAQPPVVSRRLLQETATTTATPGPRPRYTEAVHSLILNQEPWTHGTMLLGRGGSPPCPSPTLAPTRPTSSLTSGGRGGGGGGGGGGGQAATAYLFWWFLKHRSAFLHEGLAQSTGQSGFPPAMMANFL